ncbi:MAG: metallophosphoesterase family protein, partial [Microthrixaceae bacterium]
LIDDRSPMRILHCADLHIDSPLTGLSRYEGFPAEEVRGATRRAVQNLVDFALDPENRIDVVTVGGDVFDGDWEDADTGLWWNSRLGELAEADIEVFVVHGNHDAASRITTRIAAPDGVHVFGHDRPTSIEAQHVDLIVHGQSYQHAVTNEDLGSAYPDARPGRFNMGLLHTSLDGRPGHQPYAPCTAVGLAAKGYQLWGLGHIHLRDDSIEAGGSRFIFPGNVQGRHAKETGPKGAVVITVEDNRISDVEFVPFDVVRWTVAQIDISGLDDRDQVRAAVRDHVYSAATGVDTVAVRVELTGAGPLHGEFADSTAELELQLRADLSVLSDLRAGLERVKVRTTAPRTETLETSRAVQELRAFVQRTLDDPERLAALAAELAPAAQKLAAFDARLAERDWISRIGSVETVREELEGALELLITQIGAK